MTQFDKELFRERGFGQTIGFGTSPAVIVIDLIAAFTDENLPLGAPLADVIDATSEILDTARHLELPVFYTSVEYQDAELNDAGLWALKMKGLMTLRSGTAEVEVDPKLGRLASEPVIVKKYASAFFGTDLTARLNSLGIDTLVVTGCTTSGCVRATVVDTIQNGIRPIVVKEAVGDRSKSAHEQSLFDMQAKYADVTALTEVIRRLTQMR
ncbi:MAG: isochorismatase family protein [Acidimicrobiaceae bacterium]|nr:isochorismatase family protein [Acidimicrobiaceae bacterium]